MPPLPQRVKKGQENDRLILKMASPKAT